MLSIRSNLSFIVCVAFFCAVIISAGNRSALAQGSLRKVVYGETSSSASKKATPKKRVETAKKVTAPKKSTSARSTRSTKRSTGTAAKKPPPLVTKRNGMINVVFVSKEPGTEVFVNGNPVGKTGDNGIFERLMTPGTYRISAKAGTNVLVSERRVGVRLDNMRVELFDRPIVTAKPEPPPAPFTPPPTEAEKEMERAREISGRVIQIFSDFLDPLKSDSISTDEWRFVSDAAVLGSFQNLSSQQIEAQRTFAMGRVEVAEKNPTKALTSFQLSIRSFPSSPLPFIGLGDAYFASQQFEDARRSYEQARQRGKHLAIVHRRLGDANHLLKDEKEAVAAYAEAIKLGDTRYETKFMMGRSLLAAEMVGTAIPVFEELLKQEPKAEVYVALGEAFERQKRDVAALDNYRKAVELDPKLAAGHYNLARVYYEQREFEKAAQGFEKALELDGDRNTFSHEDAQTKKANASRRIKSGGK